MDEGGHLRAGCFDDCFGFPTVGMCSGVGIAIGSDLDCDGGSDGRENSFVYIVS